MKKSLTFFNDPGHGWLKVKKSDIEILKINGISTFSYQLGDYAYLEEDCDASLFIDAAKMAGWKLKIDDKHINRQSKIRNYPRYIKY